MEALAILGVVLAVPGVVDVLARASGYLWDKAHDTGPKKLLDFAQSYVNREKPRICLEIAEDLYCDTFDTNLKKTIEKFVSELRQGILDIDKNLYDFQYMKKGTKRSNAEERILKIIEKLEETTRNFRAALDLAIATKAIPSRLELKSNKFRIINGAQTAIKMSIIKTAKADIEITGRHLVNPQSCVLEDRIYRDTTRSSAYPDVKDLARTLAVLGETDGILSFAGFQIIPQASAAEVHVRLAFLYPPNLGHPRSIRDLLLASQDNPSNSIPRNYRFVLPTKIAKALLSVHSRNLVHEDLRPETIVAFEEEGSPQFPRKTGEPYLTGWELLRKTTDASSRRFSVNDWAIALYQHPSRHKAAESPQGTESELNFKYTVGHDIYSLGICMLELGLWKSFVSYDNKGVAALSALLLEEENIWKEQHPTEAAKASRTEIVQRAFLSLAGQSLAYEMGDKYSSLVRMCLSCLEKGFGNDQQFADNKSKDWEESGVQFIQRIIQELHRSSQMDV